MSRHEIPAREPELKVIVGWDHPLQTYFLQVIDRAKEDYGDDEKFVVWAGCFPREIYEIDQLVRKTSQFAEITPALRKELYADKDEGR